MAELGESGSNKKRIMLVSSSRVGGKFPQRSENLLKGMRALGYDVEVIEGFNPVRGAVGVLRKRDVKCRIFSGYRAGLAGLLVGILGVGWVYDCVEPKAKLCRDNWSGAKRGLAVFVEFAERLMLRDAKAVFAAGGIAFNYAKRFRRDVMLAPNGYDSQLFDPSRYDRKEIRKRHGIDFPLAIYIGKITPMYYKFLEPAVEAMAKVNREVPDVQFWIFGDGPERGRLESFAKEHGGKVVFKGYIEHELVPEIVTMADVGINAYDTESLKMTEWLAMGLPVISPPQVPDNSVIKTCWDADGIARTIIEVVMSPKRVWVKVPSWEDTAGMMLNSLRSKGIW